MMHIAGLDIGGTKCAVSIGRLDEQGTVSIIDKEQFPTPSSPSAALTAMMDLLEQLQRKQGVLVRAAGISCGGPLDSQSGKVHRPPNLPNWDAFDVVTPVRERFGIPVALQNDANACALAEWTWGAGRGTRNMIFLTFGTGMGAGLILDGKLYSGTNDMAGEVGHVRMEHDGPIGYGKAGSFEGFCSGGGIARLATARAKKALMNGVTPLYCSSMDKMDEITTKKVGEAAQAGDVTALAVFHTVGVRLGRGLAMLVDILNPQRIVIGSIYGRQQAILEPIVQKTFHEEVLSYSAAVCDIVPAGLGENIGDYASLSVALHALKAKDRRKQMMPSMSEA